MGSTLRRIRRGGRPSRGPDTDETREVPVNAPRMEVHVIFEPEDFGGLEVDRAMVAIPLQPDDDGTWDAQREFSGWREQALSRPSDRPDGSSPRADRCLCGVGHDDPSTDGRPRPLRSSDKHEVSQAHEGDEDDEVGKDA